MKYYKATLFSGHVLIIPAMNRNEALRVLRLKTRGKVMMVVEVSEQEARRMKTSKPPRTIERIFIQEPVM